MSIGIKIKDEIRDSNNPPIGERGTKLKIIFDTVPLHAYRKAL